MDIGKSLILAAMAAFASISAPPCMAQSIDDAGIFRRQAESITDLKPDPDTVSIVILGDIMMHSEQIKTAASLSSHKDSHRTGLESKAFDFSGYFRHIGKELSEADFAIGNMEFTLAGEPYTGYPAFSAPESFAEHLGKCGIDVFLTANNHILDKGKKGYSRTISVCDSLKSKYGTQITGSSLTEEQYFRDNPLIAEVKGIKIALVNFTYGTNCSIPEKFPKINREDFDEIRQMIGRANDAGADITIALPHWGVEYRLRHSPHQQKTAEWLAEHGADLIIGSHPHVVQDSSAITVSKTEKVPVVYSLGNAISNMSAPDTQTGLMATVKIIRLWNGKVKIANLKLDYIWCSRPGRLDENYTVIKIKDFIGKRHLWKMPYEYDKMLDSYHRVRKTTDITD